MFYNSSYFSTQRRDYKSNNNNYVIGASVSGGPLAPEIDGMVTFKRVSGGTEVTATIYGLPNYQSGKDGKAPIGPFGFHIHEFGDCSIGDSDSPFENAGGHWNPTNQPHGNHAGDLPILFSNNGFSHMTFFTNQFQPEEVLGKTVIIHQNPDDYRSQPAGDAGKRLACGSITYFR